MEREYTYAELCRMTKKRVIKIAGYKNMKQLLRGGFNKEFSHFDPMTKKPVRIEYKASKKYIAREIAIDRQGV